MPQVAGDHVVDVLVPISFYQKLYRSGVKFVVRSLLECSSL